MNKGEKLDVLMNVAEDAHRNFVEALTEAVVERSERTNKTRIEIHNIFDVRALTVHEVDGKKYFDIERTASIQMPRDATLFHLKLIVQSLKQTA